MNRCSRTIVVAVFSATLGCQPDTIATIPEVESVATADGDAGVSVRVSPRTAMVYSPVGEANRTIEFSAQLLGALGAPVVPAPPGIRWKVADEGGLSVGEATVSDDSLTTTVPVDLERAGRDSLFALTGEHSGHGVIANWEWADGSLSGPNWTVPGQGGCLDLAANDAASNPIRLREFDHITRFSFDPGIVEVDSLAVSTDGASARLCVTGQSAGHARVGVSAFDTTTFKYLGEYATFYVLQPPLTVALEASEWELGVGQSHPVRLTVTDSRGTTLPLEPEWADSWEVSDNSLLAIENGILTAKGPGSARFTVSYLGQDFVASAEIYGIVSGRFNQDVMCILTDRGTVRCWGDRWRPLFAYGRRTRGFVGPPGVGDMPLGGLALQFRQGFSNDCVRTVAGDVRCWGLANGGLLGYGNLEHVGDDETLEEVGPVPVGVPGRVVDIGGGDDFVCVVYDSGRVRCWGSNHAGQLGMGHQDQINVGDDETPADMDSDVLLGGRAVQVAGGRYKACALLDTGKVRCWGINAEDWDWRNKEVIGASVGLGYGEAFGTHEPIGDDEPPSAAGDLELPGTAKKIAVGGYHMCALMDEGAVRCWGDAGLGNLGHGDNWWEHIGDDETTAATVPLYFESPVVDLAAAYWHTCVLLENGSVRCWGDGYSSGQLGIPGVFRLGDNEKITSVPPVRVGGPVARIFLYQDGTCAVMRAGGLRCWGYNGGILGYPFTGNIGKGEHPESVGDIMLFPGPVTRASSPAFTVAATTGVDVPTPPVVFLPASPGANANRWTGPLAGPGGVILPDDIPETPRQR